MAIVYDNTSSSANTASTTLTFSHTCGSDSNRCLIVGVLMDNGAGDEPTSVTYNSVSMTKLVTEYQANIARLRCSLYGLVNPASGANNVVVTIPAGSSYKIIAGAVSFSGVAQTSTYGTGAKAKATSGNPTLNVSSANGEVVIDACCITFDPTGTMTAGDGQTERYDRCEDISYWGLCGSTENGASTTTMSWTPSATTYDWVQCGIAIKPAVASGPANVKTYKGLAAASVKTCKGLAIASVKSKKGLA